MVQPAGHDVKSNVFKFDLFLKYFSEFTTLVFRISEIFLKRMTQSFHCHCTLCSSFTAGKQWITNNSEIIHKLIKTWFYRTFLVSKVSNIAQENQWKEFHLSVSFRDCNYCHFNLKSFQTHTWTLKMKLHSHTNPQKIGVPSGVFTTQRQEVAGCFFVF